MYILLVLKIVYTLQTLSNRLRGHYRLRRFSPHEGMPNLPQAISVATSKQSGRPKGDTAQKKIPLSRSEDQLDRSAAR